MVWDCLPYADSKSVAAVGDRVAGSRGGTPGCRGEGVVGPEAFFAADNRSFHKNTVTHSPPSGLLTFLILFVYSHNQLPFQTSQALWSSFKYDARISCFFTGLVGRIYVKI